MSLDLEHEIRDTARDLAHLYRQLSTAIRTPPPPRGARIMAAKPGPREPGNLILISLDRDLVSRLHEYTRDCCNHLDPSRIITWDGAELCGWIAFNAQGVSELAFAPDLLEELQHQAHTLNRRLHPPEPATIARAPEKYIDIEAIVRNLTARGHHVTPRQAREVAVYNKFDLCKFTDGRNGYRLTDFLDHYTR